MKEGNLQTPGAENTPFELQVRQRLAKLLESIKARKRLSSLAERPDAPLNVEMQINNELERVVQELTLRQRERWNEYLRMAKEGSISFVGTYCDAPYMHRAEPNRSRSELGKQELDEIYPRNVGNFIRPLVNYGRYSKIAKDASAPNVNSEYSYTAIGDSFRVIVDKVGVTPEKTGKSETVRININQNGLSINFDYPDLESIPTDDDASNLEKLLVKLLESAGFNYKDDYFKRSPYKITFSLDEQNRRIIMIEGNKKGIGETAVVLEPNNPVILELAKAATEMLLEVQKNADCVNPPDGIKDLVREEFPRRVRYFSPKKPRLGENALLEPMIVPLNQDAKLTPGMKDAIEFLRNQHELALETAQARLAKDAELVPGADGTDAAAFEDAAWEKVRELSTEETSLQRELDEVRDRDELIRTEDSYLVARVRPVSADIPTRRADLQTEVFARGQSVVAEIGVLIKPSVDSLLMAQARMAMDAKLLPEAVRGDIGLFEKSVWDRIDALSDEIQAAGSELDRLKVQLSINQEARDYLVARFLDVDDTIPLRTEDLKTVAITPAIIEKANAILSASN